jgi:hypothetical protein
MLQLAEIRKASCDRKLSIFKVFRKNRSKEILALGQGSSVEKAMK